jgi:hypothetical protein
MLNPATQRRCRKLHAAEFRPSGELPGQGLYGLGRFPGRGAGQNVGVQKMLGESKRWKNHF